MRVSGKAVSAGGGKTSASVGLRGGSGDKGMRGACQGEWCASLEGL